MSSLDQKTRVRAGAGDEPSSPMSREIYIQDPHQGTYLMLPTLQESADTDHEIVLSDERPDPETSDVLTLEALKIRLATLERYSFFAKRKSTESSTTSTDHSPESSIDKKPAGLSTVPAFAKIPLLLELYLHLLRVVETLITEESLRKPILEIVWLRTCIETFERFPPTREYSNREIDKKAREPLASFVEKEVTHEIKARGIRWNPHYKDVLKEKTIQQIDFLFFMHHQLGMMTGIFLPQLRQSSHSKKTMPPALMVISRYFFQTIGTEIRQLKKERIRCPSITASSGTSVVENLRTAVTYAKHSSSELTCYQLLTSLPKTGTDGKNHQAATAGDLFKAAHALNAEDPSAPTVFIFNIPVNQHTCVLEYQYSFHGWYPQIAEALVMADLAFIYKMAEWRNASIRWADRRSTQSTELAHLTDLKTRYETFLKGDAHEYFSSHDIKGLKDILDFLKKAFLDESVFVEGLHTTPRDLMEKALIKLYCTKYRGYFLEDEERDQRIYGLTVQALFSALDKNNLIGCKSANERFFLTEGLTQVLEAFLYETLPADVQNTMLAHFKRFVADDIPPSHFIKYLMMIHNDYNAYGSAIAPSLLDTGTPKCGVDRHDALVISALNTNTFASGTYLQIHQSNASALQAHGKDLPRRLEHELLKVERTNSQIIQNERLYNAAVALRPERKPLPGPEDPDLGSVY